MNPQKAHQIVGKELRIKIVRAIFQLTMFATGIIGIFILENITYKLLCLYLLLTSTIVLKEELNEI